VNQQLGIETFQAEKLFKGAFTPAHVQALAEKGVATTKEFYEKTAAATQHRARALTAIADTAWGSTKLLNEKVAHNLSSNIEVAFAAAQQMASAKSVGELVRLHSDFVQRLAAQATEQAKEFVDLSTRATQHLMEKVQAAAAAPKI
jgi:phasin family protein